MTTYNCLPDHNRTAALTEAAAVLAAGKLVVMPTDTVYGIACDAFNPVSYTHLTLPTIYSV